jgi:hypothetical protein
VEVYLFLVFLTAILILDTLLGIPFRAEFLKGSVLIFSIVLSLVSNSILLVASLLSLPHYTLLLGIVSITFRLFSIKYDARENAHLQATVEFVRLGLIVVAGVFQYFGQPIAAIGVLIGVTIWIMNVYRPAWVELTRFKTLWMNIQGLKTIVKHKILSQSDLNKTVRQFLWLGITSVATIELMILALVMMVLR